MPHRTAVINVVGLNRWLLQHAPRMRTLVEGDSPSHHLRPLDPVVPAVTTTVQSSMLTGVPPREHGVVGNGWYNREYCEVHFWKQSNKLVQAEKVWETARRRDPSVTCANMFWWYNMYSSADYSVTPRPIYKADGRKIPDCYSRPADLRDTLQGTLGRFPLFNFWGPMANMKSSEWIAEATKIVVERHMPTLTLVYLPHLDYPLQKIGPEHPEIAREVQAIDRVVGDLIDFFHGHDTRVILLSEYGIEPVDDAVHVNRVLRAEGDLAVRVEQGGELLDAGASRAFAVADHQVAHVYVNDENALPRIENLCRGIEGVEEVLTREEQRGRGIDHERAGDLVLIAAPRRWFSYYYWLDGARAPDFARTVDIHRKPGYDPVELFIDPAMRTPKLRLAAKLAKKKLGVRTLMDVIPLDASLVRGSHGRTEQPPEQKPVLIAPAVSGASGDAPLPCTGVRDVILQTMFEEDG